MSTALQDTNGPLKTILDELLQQGVAFSSPHGLPIIHATDGLPLKLIPFSTARNPKCTDYDSWVCFYEDDRKFARLWINPRECLKRLKLFRGIVSPDNSLSIYADEEEQLEQVRLARFMAGLLQANGIPVIGNVRYANRFSQPFCCEGLPHNATIAVGSLGCLKDLQLRQAFIEGLAFTCDTLSPKRLLVYGGCPDVIFGQYRRLGIQVVPYETQTTTRHREAEKHRRQAREQRLDAQHGRLF